MNLLDLKEKVEVAIINAEEYGDDPDQVVVSVQIDGPGTKSVWSTDIELHYDCDTNACGCVLLGEFEGHED